MLNFIPLIFYLVLRQNLLCFEQLKYNKHRVPCLKVILNIIISLYAGKALELLELVLQTLF